MSDFRLLENEFAGSEHGSLFHHADFFGIHATDQAVFFEWEKDGTVMASIHFSAEDDFWRSPLRGTFAGFSWARDLRLEDLFGFHDAVFARLVQLGARRIEILPAPMAHDPVAFANQTYLLHARGYSFTRCDLNQNLVVDDRSLAERMSYGNLKRLRKCHKEGLASSLLPASALREVYETLAANRARRGNVLSMSFDQLQLMQEKFSQHMFLFGCHAGDELAAAALCLRLQSSVLYVFYWGDRPGYATASPVVSVADSIYSHCRSSGVSLIDAGTSSVDREPGYGLLQFKRGLGFTESLKLRMSREI